MMVNIFKIVIFGDANFEDTFLTLYDEIESDYSDTEKGFESDHDTNLETTNFKQTCSYRRIFTT